MKSRVDPTEWSLIVYVGAGLAAAWGALGALGACLPLIGAVQ